MIAAKDVMNVKRGSAIMQVLMTTLQTKYNEFLGPCFVVMKVQFIIFFVFTDH